MESKRILEIGQQEQVGDEKRMKRTLRFYIVISRLEKQERLKQINVPKFLGTT